MSLHATWESDWTHPHPFRALRLQSTRDAELGQWVVQFALLGIAVELTWVYDADAPLRAELFDQMADDSWLEKAHVWVPFPEYEAMRADADKWRAQQ